MAAIATNLQNFATVLREKNYKPSTINLYLSNLQSSGVDLQDRGTVHEVVRGHIFGDFNGHRYRSLRLYDRFVNNLPIKTIGPTKQRARMTCQEACLKMKTRSRVNHVWWLMRRRGYAPSTAVFYMHSVDKLDKNKNGRRARMALQEYEPIEIDDPVVSRHYRNLSV